MKKLYKNTWMQLIVALCTFSLAACQEYDIDSQPAAAPNIQISAQESYTALAIAPNNIVFNISSNVPWTITSDQQWCVPTPSMSASSSLVSEIVVALEDNDDIVNPKERVANLTIKAEGMNFTKKIVITQYSREKLVVSNINDADHDGVVSADGETVSFEIVSNKAWEIISYPEFVSSISPSSDQGKEDCSPVTVSLTVAANTGAKRSGEVVVRTDFEEYSFILTQNGINIVPTDEEQLHNSVNANGATTIIPITSNVEWKVEVPEEFPWISASKDGDNLNVVTKASNLLWKTFSRTGYVLLSPVETVQGFEPVHIEITQSGVAYGIYWQNGENTINEENQTVTINSSAQNRWSWDWNTHFTTGKLTFTFDSVDLPDGTACLDFNLDTWNGQPAGQGLGFWHIFIYGNNTGVLEAGSPFNFGENKKESFDLPITVNSMKTLAFEVKETENNPETLDAIVYVNDQEAYRMTVDNLFRKDNGWWGQLLYFGFAAKGEPLATATFKSLDWEVYDYGYFQ